jgi:hypothetical protein
MDELFLVCLLIIYNVVELKKGQVLFMYSIVGIDGVWKLVYQKK